MTEQTETAEAPAAPGEREITYKGHTFHANMPSPEQILVWKRTMDRLSGANMETWNGQQVLAALDRLRKIIDSLLSPADIDWLDDQMLMRQFTLDDAHGLLMAVLREYKINNREDRRAAAKAEPAAPARRKAPAKKATKKATPRKAAR